MNSGIPGTTSFNNPQSNLPIELLLEQSPMGYVILSQDMMMLKANSSACRMLGIDNCNYSNTSFLKFIDDSILNSFRQFIKDVISSDTLQVFTINQNEYNRGFTGRIHGISDSSHSKQQPLIRLTLNNSSGCREIEREFKRFRAALDSTGDFIFLLDHASFRFIDINDSAANTLGFSRQRFLSLMPHDINPDFTLPRMTIFRDKHLSEEGNTYYLELQHKNPGKEIADIELLLKTVIIDDQKIIVAIARDITERKKTQNKLALYAREMEELNTSKDKFLSIISHDLRGPFIGLKGYTQMLLEEFDLLEKEEIIDYLGKIYESSKDLYTLVDNLLKWSRLELGKIPYEPMAFNLFDEMESLMKLLGGIAAKKEISLINNIPHDVFPYADKLMLISIIQNLVGNAIKFTRHKGTVKISARQENDVIVITVEDNGIGMTPEVKEKLFIIDKGFTSKGTAGEKGTGFGLIITNEMVRKMGGEIFIESEPGVGTSFSFTLRNARHQ